MQEKKTIKISFSICLLILTIIIIIAMGYFIFNLYKQNKNCDLEINSLNNEISTLKNSIKVYEEKNETISNIDTESLNNQYTIITKELNKEELLKVNSATKNNDGTYTLKGEIYKPYTISASELKEIVKKGTMEYHDTTLIIKEGENGIYNLYPEQHEDTIWYSFVEIEGSNNYKLISDTEYTNQWKETDDYREITVSKDTKCEYSLNSYETKVDTVENVFAQYGSTEKPYGLSFTGYFSFSFENEKCILVNEIIIGH